MEYFDIHSHLYFPDFDNDREEVISRMKEAGIYTTSIGTNIQTSRQAVQLAESHENIFASVGLHPADVSGDSFSDEFESLVVHPKVVAIGECGFDFFRTAPEKILDVKNSQRKIFEQQIELAVRYNKSLMLHARPSKGTVDAYEETLNILESYAQTHGDKVFGNAHFFVGDEKILQRFLDIGFSVSFTGVITFVNDYAGLVKYVPLDSIHAETDAPFVAPLSARGKRNSPEYIPEIVETIAKIKDAEVGAVKKALISNAKKLFQIT